MSENNTDTSRIKPTYFDIFKKVLNELSWREVNDFEEITKSEHKRVLNLINSTNSEVLSSYIWDFLIEKSEIILEKNQTTILEDFGGKIISVWEGTKKYKYIHPAQFTNDKTGFSDCYSSIGDLIITLPCSLQRKLSIIYVSDMYAQDENGTKTANMQNKNDTSVLPLPYLEPILIYGTLIKVKANPSFAKFGYWRTLYYNAISNLRTSGSKSYEDSPRITFG